MRLNFLIRLKCQTSTIISLVIKYSTRLNYHILICDVNYMNLRYGPVGLINVNAAFLYQFPLYIISFIRPEGSIHHAVRNTQKTRQNI